jgi:hypothetical protein
MQDSKAARMRQRMTALPGGLHQRQIKTATGLCATTLEATLPSSSLAKPRRPWEAMTITSQPLSFAAAMIPSSGK